MERSSSATRSRAADRGTRAQPAPSPARRPRIAAATAWMLLALVVTLGAVMRLAQAPEVRQRGPDELFYTSFANFIADDGLVAARRLFADYDRDSTRWSYPVPNRISYVLATAATMRWFHDRSFGSGVLVSCLFSIASLLLLAAIGVLFFDRWVALLAVLFMAFSAGELGIAPRVWVDAAFSFFGLLLLLAAGRIAAGSSRRAWQVVFLVAAVLLFLTKQTAVVGYAPILAWLAWLLWRRGDRAGLVWLLAGAVLAVAATIAVWGALAGSVPLALSTFQHSLHPSNAGRQYVARVSTGPWFRFPWVLWRVGPIPATLALAGAFFVLRGRALAPAATRAGGIALVLTASYVAFACVVPGMQNVRYICPADGAFTLLAALGLAVPLGFVRARLGAARSGPVLAAVVVLLAAGLEHDYHVFSSRLLQLGDLPAQDVLDALARPEGAPPPN